MIYLGPVVDEDGFEVEEGSTVELNISKIK